MRHNYSCLALLIAAVLGVAGCNSDNDGSGSSPVSEVIVPTLAYDDTSVVLTWHKPDNYSNIVDYRVYQNGKAIGLASDNNDTNNPGKPYMDEFYKLDTEGYQYQVTFQNFKVTDLEPGTQYRFSVAAVYSDGTESARSPATTITTATYAKTVDITDYGAVGDGSTVNTDAIQDAIDACADGSTSAYGCHVVVPADGDDGSVFVTGALFLKSNMTFEVETGATLQGSTDTDDYPLSEGYQLYSYETHTTDSRRPPSLLNALDEDHMNTTQGSGHGYNGERDVFENIRVVGGGTLDGSGWELDEDDPQTTDEVGNTLPYYAAGSKSKVYQYGILAKNQVFAGYQEYNTDVTSTDDVDTSSQVNKDMYSDRRSSLATFRGVKNMYVGGLTFTNPAYHGIMFLEGQNLVMAYTTTQTFDINNADGVEFGNSETFKVFANFIDSGDDCINFAAGQGADYEDGNPTEDGWVFNNYTREGHGVLVAGSHTAAGIEDILAEDNVAYLTDNGLRLKSTTATGGGAWDITFRDTAMRSIGLNDISDDVDGTSVENRGGKGNPFVITLSYSAGDNVFTDASEAAYFHDITVKNVTLNNVDTTASGKAVIAISGYDGTDSDSTYAATYHKNILFDDVQLYHVKVTDISELQDSTFKDMTITDWEDGYDSPWQISDSSNLTFDNVTPTWSESEE